MGNASESYDKIFVILASCVSLVEVWGQSPKLLKNLGFFSAKITPVGDHFWLNSSIKPGQNSNFRSHLLTNHIFVKSKWCHSINCCFESEIHKIIHKNNFVSSKLEKLINWKVILARAPVVEKTAKLFQTKHLKVKDLKIQKFAKNFKGGGETFCYFLRKLNHF